MLDIRSETIQFTDVDLLKAVARGDERALSSLYDRYRLILFGLLLRILTNRAEAEDVLQEVFIQVWQRAWDFDAERGKPFTWLVTLTRSRAIDRLRSLGSRERTAEEASRNVTEAIADAEHDAIISQRSKVVRAALNQLSDDQKRVLFLAYFDGCSQSEIAERLNSPLGTVKTRMRTGMMKLRELLGSQSDELM
ncbi:MAG: sigma-70 family RNA polymerase sigma factor [Pyrinomonadaceae bacterium]|nr:sigma-70 family RNA polymerase sigma factor [Pyrinomonadaceae bacterium]